MLCVFYLNPPYKNTKKIRINDSYGRAYEPLGEKIII